MKRPSLSLIFATALFVTAIAFNSHYGASTISNGSDDGVIVRDLGLFVVANSYPANGTSAPLALVAGTWGQEYDIYSPTLRTFNFNSADLGIDVNATLVGSVTVYLELGTSELPDSFTIWVNW